MMAKRMTLIEAYQKTPTNIGVMSDYNRWSDNVPYLPTNQVASIDNMYYLMHSGDKYISPYVKRVMSFDFPSETGWRTLIGKDLSFCPETDTSFLGAISAPMSPISKYLRMEGT